MKEKGTDEYAADESRFGDRASSGIGNATAKALVAAGYITYATARRVEALNALKKLGCRVLQLDVTDEHSMVAAVQEAAEHGAVDVLVNNAGYGEMGPIEEVAVERWRRQFETNVFGPARLVQLVLPGMRKQHSGRIINVSSMGGEMTFPFAGVYHASKYAVEALSDALRFEVAPFGIDVIVIQPSAVRTPLGDASVKALQTAPNSPYANVLAAYATVSGTAYEQGIGIEKPERAAIAAAMPALVHAIELERTPELPLHPHLSASPQQHTAHRKEKE